MKGEAELNAEIKRLQQSVEEQAKELDSKKRELEVEVALERVRARAMAMYKSDELSEVVAVLYEQMNPLGLASLGCELILCDEKKSELQFWSAIPGQGKLPEYHPIPKDIHPFFLEMWQSWKKKKSRLIVTLEGTEKREFDNLIFEQTAFKHFPESAKNSIRKGKKDVFSIVTMKYGLLEASDIIPLEEQKFLILERFAKVFEQTYTRFLDLKKAEAQARESEIELALERIRAKTMAMRQSSELSEAATVLFEQVFSLGFEPIACAFSILNKKNKTGEVFISADGSIIPQSYQHPYSGESSQEKIFRAWENGEPYSIIDLAGKPLQTHLQFIAECMPVQGMLKSSGQPQPERLVLHIFNFKHGFLGVNFLEPEPEVVPIMERFAKVFEQTYARFLDLQKAEAQAREAQIVASLERVRAATMSMHQSDELSMVLSKLFEQFDVLGIKPSHAVLTLINQEKNTLNFRTTGKNGYHVLAEQEVDLNVVDAWLDTAEKWKKSKPNAVNVNEYPPEVLPDVWEVYKDILAVMPKKARPEIKDFPEGLFITEGYCKFGYIGFAHHRKPTAEEQDIVRRIAVEFGTLYQRFLDLQKAEAQAREAQIQLALERIRAKTMAMKTQSDLLGIVELFGQQLSDLDVRFTDVTFIEGAITKDRDWELWSYVPSANNLTHKIHIPYIDTPYFTKTAMAVEEYERTGNAIQTKFFSKEEKDEFLDHYWKYAPAIPEKARKLVYSNPGSTIVDAFLEEVTVSIVRWDLEPFTDEELSIFGRFAKEFKQTYTRFLDIKKAEVQARKAEIELALERVRARTMAMHNSDELAEASSLLFQQMEALGVHTYSSGFTIWDEKKGDLVSWMCNADGSMNPPFRMPIEENKWHKEQYDSWKKGDDFIVKDLNGEEMKSYFRYLRSFPLLDEAFKTSESAGHLMPERQVHHVANFSQGNLLFITLDPVPEAHEIFKRFAKVFDQTYTRFLDLQKAEVQAKEAQIELSLERIRAQVTAMKASTDLLDIVVTMRSEFVKLGHEAHYFWHMRWLPEIYQKAMTSGDGSKIGMIMSLPRRIHGDIPKVAAWEKGTDPVMVLDMDTEVAVDYVDKMVNWGDFEQVDPNAPTLEDIRHIQGLTFVMARTTHGEIGFSLPGKVPNPSKESMETLQRFASVFDLAYRRFEDLLTAEKQNRKAKIELALERVRARAMAMQQPEELIEVAQVMREEMGLLGVEELETSSIYINKDTAGKAECWYSIKDIRNGAKTYIADYFNLNYKNTWVGRQMLNFHQGDETKTSILMQGKNRIEWINYCANQSPKLDGYYGTEIPERTYHLTKFSNGAIGAATPGEISSESWDLLRRSAQVFSLAYSRFKDLSQAREDLKKLKKAKAKAEKALKNLKAAQEQLVQQEKLASLGQLTAGIAHEIKNPLNFVNNFSDLSRELIEEAFEELENTVDSDAKEEVIAILNDVKSNLIKVHEHGSRADGIVTSMLQHSRASGSKQEAKAFNPLVKEFVNLSFHGMRAGRAPINVDIALQLDPKVGEVTLISEDFSRVILNLCNNAFDAMRDKFLKTGDGRRETENGNSYLPKLTVKTALQKDKVIFSIADNGSGIPEEIRDKILQPFFTTKKGTEGTGLGLSITHDIIKAHGGELKVESTQGKGSIFSIQLPLV